MEMYHPIQNSNTLINLGGYLLQPMFPELDLYILL